MDPDQLAGERRIGEATVDVELAWEARADSEREVASAEAAVAADIARLLAERLSAADLVKRSGLDQMTVRRLRQAWAAAEPASAHIGSDVVVLTVVVLTRDGC